MYRLASAAASGSLPVRLIKMTLSERIDTALGCSFSPRSKNSSAFSLFPMVAYPRAMLDMMATT
jgi:hypothetical protein